MIFGGRNEAWFAWHPVRFDSGPDEGRWVWLERVKRARYRGFWWYHPISK